MRKTFESSYGFGGRYLKIRDVCMDLEPCFKVHNLAVIQLKNTKLGQMTNFNVIFLMVLSLLNLNVANIAKICSKYMRKWHICNCRLIS